jgi:uncharacterized protein (DUF1697 family)
MPDELYIALIRGINVGAHNQVAMADLRQAVSGRGGSAVSTVLNSGNVLLGAGTREQAAAYVSQSLAEDLQVPAEVIVLSAAEFKTAAATNPLSSLAENPSRLLLAFTQGPADIARLQPLLSQDWNPEALALGEYNAWLWCPQGVIASRLVKAMSRLLGEGVTMRSKATVDKIAAMVAQHA